MEKLQEIESIFKEQHELVDYFFANLNYPEVEDFIEAILEVSGNPGIIYLTGMGKSGIIASNISQMLVSIGIRAMFLSPVNALHGDVGVLTSRDALVLFSRSGQTSELLNLIPAARNKKTYLIGVVSNREGKLAKQCDQMIYLPLKKELCPFDLAPTTSSVLQLIFGNTVVSLLMKRIGLTREAYAMNHPAGRIGKRLTAKVSDVMRSVEDTAICGPDDRLIDQIGNMSKKRGGCLVVLNNTQQVIGILTDGDLRRQIEKHGVVALELTLGELMTKKPWTTTPTEMAFDSMQEMERSEPNQKKKCIKEMPVISDEDGTLIGLITLHSLVQYGL